jgi:hypothetical protein
LRAISAADTETLLVPPHNVASQPARIAFEDEFKVSRDASGAG